MQQQFTHDASLYAGAIRVALTLALDYASIMHKAAQSGDVGGTQRALTSLHGQIDDAVRTLSVLSHHAGGHHV